MQTTVIYEDEHTKVVKVDYRGRFLYTRVYIFDVEGYVNKSITLCRDGRIIEH